jgi:hypothetical protein
MEPKVIFDAATKPFVWQHVLVAASVFAFGSVIVALKRLSWRYALSEKWGYFLMVAAIVAASYDAVHWYALYHDCVNALRSGEYNIIEGPVEDFRPMPDNGSSKESFSIAGQMFSYSDDPSAAITPCFNQTKPHGGPVRDGLRLRVRFVGECILEIEALPSGVASAHNR